MRQRYARRAADILLRAMGGTGVTLRMPAPAVPADVTEQLGIATPQFQDMPLGPAVQRKARVAVADGKPAKCELLVSATAVERLTGSQAYGSASALFAEACGVLSEPDGELMEIVSATPEPAVGEPYVYRLVLHAPLASVV